MVSFAAFRIALVRKQVFWCVFSVKDTSSHSCSMFSVKVVQFHFGMVLLDELPAKAKELHLFCRLVGPRSTFTSFDSDSSLSQ